MKILALIGSPKRNGNTFKTIKEVEDRIKVLDKNVDFEYVFLSEKNIIPCKGCYVCVEKGEHLCPLKDDINEIKKKMLEVDGIILSSPVYNLNISSLLKTFIDRIPYFAHRPQLFNKYLMVVVTAGGDGIKETVSALSKYEAWGVSLAASIGISVPPIPLLNNLDKKNSLIIEKATLKFYSAIKEQKYFSPTLRTIIVYRVFKQLLADEERSKKYFPADYSFWMERNWLNKHTKFYTDSYIPLYKRVAAGIITNTVAKLRI